MATTIERLEEMLNQKDKELDDLRDKLAEAEDAANADHAWTKHRSFKVDPSPFLPVPRLELRWVEQGRDDDGHTVRCEYSLVYRHLLGDVVFIPLGLTRSDGALAKRLRMDGLIDTPFRDGAHFQNEAKQLGLPAFVVLGDRFKRLEFEEAPDPKKGAASRGVG